MNNEVIKTFSSKKTRFFMLAGGVGGLLSGMLAGLFNFNESTFSSWVYSGALDAALIGALIVCAQSYYQSKNFFRATKIKQSLILGAFLGGLGGLAALFSINILGSGDFGRIIGWAISGAAAGFVVSKQIPNLDKKHSIIAGALGATLGCIIMYINLGYTTGVVITGAAIGLVVASAEELMRKSWIEITEYSDVFKETGINLSKVNNKYTLTMGNDPISIGYSPDMDILLKKSGMALEKEVATLTVESDRFFMLDIKLGTKSELFPNTPVKVQNCELKICSSA
ncbi:hypothetical protein [Endozoicomonas euniceicola]|uniref:Uncharacterized protein n=1 Tax=Endozoicomonas euniceicola TaxID=1234143 RepID=A0ABY6GS62_9GAMM|nr:hypothetical protein [Endozoicomonas euniceicola]UYM14923.1 hypothetical protein NX720_18820 [Endozoicomonas euniceicola]